MGIGLFVDASTELRWHSRAVSPELVRIDDCCSVRVPREDAWPWREAATGSWEPESLQVVRDVIREGDLVIDVGAYVGIFAAVVAGKRARVHAFEPDPVARAQLERMLELNPEIAAYVAVHPEALGASDRSAMLSSEALGNSGSSLVRDQAGGVDVIVRDAVAALTECGVIDCKLLKIDVEGSEYELLPHLLPLLRQSQATLLLAVHSYHLREPFARLPLLIRGVRFRLRALPRQWKLISAARTLGPTFLAEPNSGRWRRLRGLNLIAALASVREKELLVRPLAPPCG